MISMTETLSDIKLVGPKSNIGFYTGKYCKTNIDHVVYLRDAYESGANFCNHQMIKIF